MLPLHRRGDAVGEKARDRQQQRHEEPPDREQRQDAACRGGRGGEPALPARPRLLVTKRQTIALYLALHRGTAGAFVETEDAVISKAIDDRVGLFVILETLKRRPKISCDLYVSATVQEEVGLRGANVIVPVYEPDFAIAIEGTVSNDLPGVPDHKTLAKVGKGPEIRLSDRYLVAHRALSFFMREVAEKRNIPHQITVKKAGSTNATAMQVTGKGTRVGVVSVPVRYLHSPSCLAYKSDIEETIKLTTAILEEIEHFGQNTN